MSYPARVEDPDRASAEKQIQADTSANRSTAAKTLTAVHTATADPEQRPTLNLPVSTPVAAAPAKLDAPEMFINRELSWLECNARVVAEAADSKVQLYERLKFLAIFATNLD